MKLPHGSTITESISYVCLLVTKHDEVGSNKEHPRRSLPYISFSDAQDLLVVFSFPRMTIIGPLPILFVWH